MIKDMKFLLIFVLLIYYVHSQVLSEKQVKAASKLIKNVCQPKNKVTNEQINAMHKGQFTDDRPMMCYMECSLRMGKLIKNGKFDLPYALQQAETLPETRKQPTIETATACKDAAVSSDKCVAATEIYKCMYFHNPSNFFLP